MKEKSTIEILVEFAKQKGLKYYTNSSVQKFRLSPSERYSSSKFVVFDLQDTSKNTFVVFYDTYSSRSYNGITYCGIFKLIRNCNNEIKVLKRDWFDRLSFKRRVKTGSRYIDRNVTIFSGKNDVDRSIVNSEIIRKYLQISKRIMPLELDTIKNSESVVPELNGNNLIALKTNSWISDTEELEYFIEHGVSLMKKIS